MCPGATLDPLQSLNSRPTPNQKGVSACLDQAEKPTSSATALKRYGPSAPFLMCLRAYSFNAIAVEPYDIIPQDLVILARFFSGSGLL